MASRWLASAPADGALINATEPEPRLGSAHHWRVQGPNHVCHPAYRWASMAASASVAGWGDSGTRAAGTAVLSAEWNCAQITRPR